MTVRVAVNNDPNTFDRTLLSIHNGDRHFTVAVDDLKSGALFLPDFGAAVLAENDGRSYEDVAAAQKSAGGKTLYERIADLPEQTWKKAWEGLPRKKADINFPMGLDGGRQRSRLEPNGGFGYRTADHFLRDRPGKDTPRLKLEPEYMTVRFGLPNRPTHRTIEEGKLPICYTAWETNGLIIQEVAQVTSLEGMNGRAGAGFRYFRGIDGSIQYYQYFH